MRMIHLLFICLFILNLLLLRKKLGRKKQVRNMRTAKEVYERLKRIQGDNKEARIISYLRKIDPFVFEELLLDSFERQGYTILRNERYTHDGGIDGRIYLNGESFLIQAKRYGSYINPRHLADFSDAIGQTNATGGFFVHTGKTGKGTYGSYRNDRLQIISGKKLIDLILGKA